MRRIATVPDVEDVLRQPRAILFKHSTTCPISAKAYREVTAFAERHPDEPVYLVRVQEERPASNAIEEKTGILHESPQILVVRDGRVVWHASHFDITADAIAAHRP